MPEIFKDRVLETTTTTGTGTVTLAGAVTGHQAFSVVGNGGVCYYTIYGVDGSGNPTGAFEVGKGKYTTSGTTLSREEVFASSNSGALVNFGAGTKRAALTLPSSKITSITPEQMLAEALMPPQLKLAVINVSGNLLTLTFSKRVDYHDGFIITPSASAATLVYLSGDGTKNLIFTLSRSIATSETATIDYSPGNVVNVLGIPLGAIKLMGVTNSSAYSAVDLADLSNLVNRYESTDDRFDATSGGSAVNTDAASIKRWEDQVGTAHLTQTTTAKAPVYDAQRELVVSSVNYNQGFDCPAGMTIDRRAFTLLFVLEFAGMRVPYDAVANQDYRFLAYGATDNLFLAVHTKPSEPTFVSKIMTLPHAGGFEHAVVPYGPSRCLIAFVGDTTEMRVWVNEVKTARTPLTAGNTDLTSLLYYSPGAWPSQCAVRTIARYSRALSDSEMTNTVWKWAHQSRGVSPTRQNQVIIESDSNGGGVSLVQGYNPCNRSYAQRLTLPPHVMIRNMSYSGGSVDIALGADQDQIHPLFIAGQTTVICLLPLGGNEIQGDDTAVNVWADIVAYCTAARVAAAAAGAYVKILWGEITPRGAVYYTAPREAERIKLNATAHANWEGVFDYPPINLTTAPFDVPTNATYFSDEIHFTDALHQEVRSRVQPAIEHLLGL